MESAWTLSQGTITCNGVIIDPSEHVIGELPELTAMVIAKVTSNLTNDLKPLFENIPALIEYWKNEYSDLFGPIPLVLPPFWEVNHHIPLIEPDKKIQYHMPRCPDALKGLLTEKIEHYVKVVWWEPTVAWQAIPTLCLHKQVFMGLRTVFDLRLQNDNTKKDMTPFLDQETI